MSHRATVSLINREVNRLERVAKRMQQLMVHFPENERLYKRTYESALGDIIELKATRTMLEEMT